ncbi:MAG: hypothetical protein KBS77_02115 [Bacteroidales bacterium]|nr:hypothetical protein [Candidatus Colicola faecequi]
MKRFILVSALVAIVGLWTSCNPDTDVETSNLVRICNAVQHKDNHATEEYLGKLGFIVWPGALPFAGFPEHYDEIGFARDDKQTIYVRYIFNEKEIGASQMFVSRSDAMDAFYQWERTMVSDMEITGYEVTVNCVDGETYSYKGAPKEVRGDFLKELKNLEVATICLRTHVNYTDMVASMIDLNCSEDKFPTMSYWKHFEFSK